MHFPHRLIPLLAAGLTLLAAAAASAEERFALVFGDNVGWANDQPLRHAETDAEHVRSVLIELGGFAPDRVVLLRAPLTGDVRAQLRRLSETLRGLKSESLVLVYYSGHADQRHLHLRGEPMTHDEFHELVRDLPATVRVGILDACKSGSILASKGARPVTPFEVKVVDDLKVSGVAFLTSSGADELSQETRALAGSVFTHHLVSGMRGAADADLDGQVTLSEAYGYAHARTTADTAPTPVPQRPAFRFELKGQGEVVLTRVVQAAASLVLPRADGDRYVVMDPQEWQLVAEGRANPQRETVIGLPTGTYRVKRVLPDHMEVAEVGLQPGMRLPVGALAFAPVPLSNGLLKGRPEDTDLAGMREFQRQQAFKMLASGEAGSALTIFSNLLASQPDDWASVRGKARALVRLAEAYEQVGDHVHERESLRGALVTDPTLSEDPDFRAWYRRLDELDRGALREQEIRRSVERELKQNPRLKRHFGLGVDTFTPRGFFSLVATGIVADMVMPHLAVDFVGPGLDLGVRVVPMGWNFSPFVGVGAHLTGATLGWMEPNRSVLTGSTNGVQSYQLTYQDIFGKSVHFDLGVQYFAQWGFATELGLGLTLYRDSKADSLGLMILPLLNVGFFF